MRSISLSCFPHGCATGSKRVLQRWPRTGALILLVRGMIGPAIGLVLAVVAKSGLFWVGLVILIFAPETRGHELPD